MELFKLFGKILVDNNEANKSIEDTTNLAKNSSKNISKLGEGFAKVGQGLSNVGKKMMPVTLAIGGIATASVKTAADFESAMSQVAATMGMTSEEINNGSEDFEKLSNAAREMGKKTKYSAKEAADALNYLALAGYDVDKSIETLPQVLNLAAAGGIDLASASDMVTDAMSALGKTAGTTQSFVDKMAKASQKSNTSVAQLGEAILTVGGTAKNLAGGTTELNTALGILADNGIKGAEGGTALRNIILSLSAPTDQAAKDMKRLGLNVYDAQGNMRPLNDIFKDLDKSLGKMSQQEKINVLNNLFNKVDLKSANALLANCGDRFDELSGYINNADGAAGNMADTMNNNLNGKLTILKSALSEAAIAIGQKLIPYIEILTEKVQKATDWFNGLSEGQMDLVVKIGAIVAAIGPVLIVFGKLASAVSNILKLSKEIGPLLAKAKPILEGISTAIGGISASMLAVVAVIAVLVSAFVYLWNTNEEFRNNIIATWEEIKNTLIGFLNGITEEINDLGFDFESFGEIVKEIWQKLCDYLAPAFEVTFKNISILFKHTTEVILGLLKIFIGIFTGDWEKVGEGIKKIVSSFLNTIKNYFMNGFNAINQITGGKLSEIANGIRNKLTDAKNAVVNIINNIKSAFQNGFNAAKDTVSSVLDSIRNKIRNVMDNAISIVRNAINAIKGVFNFNWSLPPLKLPHISVSGGEAPFGIGGKGSLPQFNIQWYKKAMEEPVMFTEPTLFDYNPITGQGKGAGEAGDEIMYGKSNLMRDISNAVAESNESIVVSINYWFERMFELFMTYFPEFAKTPVFDVYAAASALAIPMDKELGRLSIKKERGR